MKSRISSYHFQRRGGLGFAVPAMLMLVVFAFNATAQHNRGLAMSKVATGPVNAPQAAPPLLIDSFKAGPTPPVTEVTPDRDWPGNPQELMGGSRHIHWSKVSPDKQPGSYQVVSEKPALFVNAGYHVMTQLQISYKVPPDAADLTKHDRILMDFDGLGSEMRVTIVVYGNSKVNDGHTGNDCKVAAPAGPFTLSFPFTHLEPEVLKKAYKIVFELQPNRGGSDYALTRITSAKGDPAGKNIVTCMK